MPHVFTPSPNRRPTTAWRSSWRKWNESITRKLLDGAVGTLTAAAWPTSAIDVAWVPGAWEIPLVAQRLADPAATAP